MPDITGLKSVIDERLCSGRRVIVFIDGMAGAGKTTLAGKLEQQYNCSIINMDSFFLQPQQKTQQRLAEIGGNIDYERFILQVITPLRENRLFSYNPYDCSKQKLSEPVTVKPHRLTVIEGVYSLHPKIMAALSPPAPRDNKQIDENGRFDIISVFMKTGTAQQRSRLLSRSSAVYKQFVEHWLPMENKYFEHFAILDKCDIVLEN